MPNTEEAQAQHRKGLLVSDYSDGWVNITHPDANEVDWLSGDRDSHLNPFFVYQKECNRDWVLMYDPKAGKPLWKRAYIQAEAAAYKGYRRAVEATEKGRETAAWVGEVGGKVLAVVGGEKGESDGKKGEKLEKE